MKILSKRLVMLVTLIVASAFATDEGPAIKTCSLLNGRGWGHLSENTKVFYLTGLRDGITTISSEAHKPEYAEPYMAPGVSLGDVMTGIDGFYSDAANVLIPVAQAVSVYMMKLHGETPAKIAEETLIDRRTSVVCIQNAGHP